MNGVAEQRPNKIFHLLFALADGDAKNDDIVAALRNEGVFFALCFVEGCARNSG
jgi:hypothetical protein